MAGGNWCSLRGGRIRVNLVGIRWTDGGNYFTLQGIWLMKDIGKTANSKDMESSLMKSLGILIILIFKTSVCFKERKTDVGRSMKGQ